MSGLSITPAEAIADRRSDDAANCFALLVSAASNRITISVGSSAERKRRGLDRPEADWADAWLSKTFFHAAKSLTCVE